MADNKSDKSNNNNVNNNVNKAFATVFASYNNVYGKYIYSWQEVVDILDNPVLLDIDINDYKALKATNNHKWLMLKFKNGGYDAGECPMELVPKTDIYKPSREEGVPRPSVYNMIVLDADDNLTAEFDVKIKNALSDYEYYIHATISSTADKPKRRVLIPVAVPVDLDIREAVIRYLANIVGMECIDRACIHNKQLMCFPVHCKNADTYHYHNKGKFLNATEWLPAGWENVENWPQWEKDKAIVKSTRRERKYIEETGQWLPYPDKNKLHDAFNKTYKASDILTKHGYTQTDNRRWSHAGSCSGGIKVTNNSVIYSYYGNDKLSVNRDLDAYEAELVLTYGDIYNKQNWKLMQANVAKDEAVKQTLLNNLTSTLPADLPADASSWEFLYDSTEEGLAQRANAYYPHKVRDGKWWRYENGIYTEVKDATMLRDALQIIRIASTLQPDDQILASMVGKVTVARNVQTAWKAIAEESDEWEEHPWYLCFTDCVIDLQAWCKGEDYVLQHSPDYMLTKCVGYAWEDVVNFDKYALDEIVTNMEKYLPDEELRNYFQIAMGRCLTTAAAAEDKCCWLMGPYAGNGKSTILSAVIGALGGNTTTSYYHPMKGKYLYYNARESGESPCPALAGMRDKRYVNFSEYDGTKILDPEKYKNYTSAGYIVARKLHSDDNSFTAKNICTIDCNAMPALEKRDAGVLRRTRVILFNANFRDGDQAVKNRWMSSKAIHIAMMVWLLNGLKMWYDNGCRLDAGLKTAPKSVYQEVMSWYSSYDDPTDFFEDYYKITNDQKDYLIADECWDTYVSQVCVRGANRAAFRQAETRWLREHGITSKGKRRIRRACELRRECWLGVKLISNDDLRWNHEDNSNNDNNDVNDVNNNIRVIV